MGCANLSGAGGGQRKSFAPPAHAVDLAYDHVDFRVRDLRSLVPFYDAFMRAMGFCKITRGERSREYHHKDRGLPFFGLTQSITSTPSRSRIAFAAKSREEVDRVASAVRRAGARAIEGPEKCTSYRQPYYAVFFKDPDGNRFEVCCRR